MQQPEKIPVAFASSGDRNNIAKTTDQLGLASWSDGFPAICSQPFSEGGIAPKRADFNGIFYAMSRAILWAQQGGIFAYDTDTDYEAGNVVLDGGALFIANAANGPTSAVVQPSTDTTGATWKPVRLDLATQSAAGYMSAADKSKLDNLITYNNLKSLLHTADSDIISVQTQNLDPDTSVVSFRKIGNVLVLYATGKLLTQLPAYSERLIATGLPSFVGVDGVLFPLANVFFNSASFFGAFLHYTFGGDLYFGTRSNSIPANILFFSYCIVPYTL